jgi:hypothetical protein
MQHNRVVSRAAAVAGCLAVALWVAPAEAQQNEPATGAGIAGGALVGAEIVLLTETALGVRPTWAYVVGGVVGAAGGGYAGYVIEQRAAPGATLYLYAAGVALLIPTIVWLGRAHEPKPPPVPLDRDHALLVLEREGPRLAVPAVEIRSVFSPRERLQLGVEDAQELRLPLLAARF